MNTQKKKVIISPVITPGGAGLRPARDWDADLIYDRLIPNSKFEIAVGAYGQQPSQFLKDQILTTNSYTIFGDNKHPEAILTFQDSPYAPDVVYVSLYITDEFVRCGKRFLRLGRPVFDEVGNTCHAVLTSGIIRKDLDHTKFLEFFKFRLLAIEKKEEHYELYTYGRTY